MDQGSSVVSLGNNYSNDEHRHLHPPPPLDISTAPALLCRSTSLTSLSTVSDLEDLSSHSSVASGHNSILADDALSALVAPDASAGEDAPSTASTVPTTAANKRGTDRAAAAAVQLKVQQAWRERRVERNQRQETSNTKPASFSSSSSKNKPPPHQPLKHRNAKAPFAFIPLCAVVQKTWSQAFDGGKTKNKPKKAKEDRPKVFPSMLSILQSNALVSHVRDLKEEEDDDEEEEVEEERAFDLSQSDGSTARSSDSPRDQAPAPTEQPSAPSSDPAVQSVLSILPAGYDWNAAILQMARSRSRAFLLLDLAAIVRRTVLWKRLHPQVTWVHSVSANANPKLLQVLLVAGVRLATTTRTDVAHALAAKSKLKAKATKPQPTQLLVADSTGHVAPPDSYLRELLGAKVTRLTVDGPDEVRRIVRVVQRVQARRGTDVEAAPLELELVLRLPVEPSKWEAAVDATLRAVRQYPEHRLAGISLDVIGTSDTCRERQERAEHALQQILAETPDALVQVHLTGLEDWAASPSSGDSSSSVSSAASYPSGDAPFPPEWVQWWSTVQQREPRIAEIAVECSHRLIASAGALCTRIIGVREHGSSNGSDNSGSDDDHDNEDESPLPKQSLYIDDGCYGSLYQTKGDLNPIPLGNYKHPDPSSGDCVAPRAYSTTVWGPTCDGLDRVCRDIRLPKLERDDWLVFPDLGCPGGLGTAFNGFEPPDTAYCVLGYFK